MSSESMASVEVFTSPTCPHCPPAKTLAKDIAGSRGDVELKIYSTHEPEGSRLARKYQIMSVPTIIIKGPGSKDPIGLSGLPPRRSFEKAIDISLGKERWPDKKPSFFDKVKAIFKKPEDRQESKEDRKEESKEESKEEDKAGSRIKKNKGKEE